jgi:hypothetical protein
MSFSFYLGCVHKKGHGPLLLCGTLRARQACTPQQTDSKDFLLMKTGHLLQLFAAFALKCTEM